MLEFFSLRPRFPVQFFIKNFITILRRLETWNILKYIVSVEQNITASYFHNVFIRIKYIYRRVSRKAILV